MRPCGLCLLPHPPGVSPGGNDGSVEKARTRQSGPRSCPGGRVGRPPPTHGPALCTSPPRYAWKPRENWEVNPTAQQACPRLLPQRSPPAVCLTCHFSLINPLWTKNILSSQKGCVSHWGEAPLSLLWSLINLQWAPPEPGLCCGLGSESVSGPVS